MPSVHKVAQRAAPRVAGAGGVALGAAREARQPRPRHRGESMLVVVPDVPGEPVERAVVREGLPPGEPPNT